MATSYLAPISQTFRDKANKTSDTSWIVSRTALESYVADPTVAGSVRNLFDAVEAMSLLTLESESAALQGNEYPTALPTDDQAYRSSKLEITMDSVGADYSMTRTIPGRDPAAYNTLPGTDIVALTIGTGGTAAVESLVTAINNAVRDPFGNQVTVRQIKVVGRNT